MSVNHRYGRRLRLCWPIITISVSTPEQQIATGRSASSLTWEQRSTIVVESYAVVAVDCTVSLCRRIALATVNTHSINTKNV